MAQNQYPTVPLTMSDVNQHVRLISTSLNNTISGKLNSTGQITLTNSSTTTVLNDARIGGNSVILLMPLDNNASNAHVYFTNVADGTATLNHGSGSSTRTFKYVVIG